MGGERAGKVGTGVGVDVYGLRTADQPWSGLGLEIKKTSERTRLAAMHHHFSMEGRDLITCQRISKITARILALPRRPSTNRDTALTPV